MKFIDIVEKCTQQNGRLNWSLFEDYLQETKYLKRFQKIKEANPELAWKGWIHIFLHGRPTCKCCSNTTNWQSRGKGYFTTYCSAKCQNRDLDKIQKQGASLSKVCKKEAEAVSRAFKKYADTTVIKLTKKQIVVFKTVITKLNGQPREFDILKGLDIPHRKLWINLPGSTPRSRLLMATGQIPLQAACQYCKKNLTLCRFYGWPKYCSPQCSTKATAGIRCTPQSRAKSSATYKARIANEPELKASLVNRIKDSLQEQYGVTNPSQVPAIARKRASNITRRKKYKLGKRTVYVQGFEPQALDLLLRKYKPTELQVESEGTVPHIKYKDKFGKRHWHYPDIYIPKENRLVEVKSTYTLFKSKKIWQQNCAKAKAAEAQGYQYNFMLIRKGKYVQLPLGWSDLSYKEIKKVICP